MKIISLMFAAIMMMSVGQVAQAAKSPSSVLPLILGRTIDVPLDYSNPKLGHAPLYFEFGAPFNRVKPTVFLIADAQQFYVRKGAIAGLQKSLFGSDFNVVGLVPRGTGKQFITATLDTQGRPDWVKAWHIFNSAQFLNDIDTVRRAVVGENGKILLYGASGGGFLSHQYLAKYGAHVLRAFTPSALNPFLEGELGLNSDHFWQEIGAYDPSLQPLLQTVLKQHASDRATLVMTLQRQNFFVTPDKIEAARASLIRALAAGDQRRYEEAQKEYQVPDVSKFFDSPEGIPIRVRLFEFFYPMNALARVNSSEFYPDLENQYNFAKPLMALCAVGKIPKPQFNFAALHRLNTEVFVLAGRQDHTADYRSLMALAAYYPQHLLFIANDNHTFAALSSDGTEKRLVKAFFSAGLHSSELQSALDAALIHRWREE